MARGSWLAVAALIALAAIGFVGWQVIGGSTTSRAAVAIDATHVAAPPAADLAVAPVAAEPAPAAPPAVEPVEPAAEETRDARASAGAEAVELEGALWVAGRVLFPPRTPADERVAVVAEGRSFESFRHHRADVAADGSFRVAFHPKTRKGRVRVDARYLYGASEKLDPSASTGDVTIEPRLGGLLTVTLLPPENLREDDPDPRSVTLSAASESGHRSASADLADGVFAFELGGLSPEAYWISANPEGWVELALQGRTIAAGEHARLELRLELGARIQGRVVDADGTGVAGVELQARSMHERDGESTWSSASTRSAADGTFALLGVRGAKKVDLTAELEGYVSAKSELVELADRERRDDVVVTLDRGHSVAGRVVGPDGSPVPGARIRVEREVQTNHFFENDRDATSIDDGSFEVTGLKPGTFRILVNAERPAPAGKESIEERRERRRSPLVAVAEGVPADTRDLVLALAAGGSVSGTVVDDDGAPVPTFRVEYGRAESGEWNDKRSRSFRDTDGTFTLEGLSDGEWTLSASTRDHAPTSNVLVRIPDPREAVRLVVQRGVRLAGAVVDDAGLPVAGARVQASRHSGANHGMSFGWNPWDSSETTTDADGRYELAHLGAGRVTIQCEAAGYAQSQPLQIELVPGEQRDDLTITLSVGGRVEGRLHPRPGLKLEGQRINVHSELFWKTATTDEQGHFLIEQVPAGKLSLSCQHERGTDSLAVDVVDRRTTEVVLGLPNPDGLHVFGSVTRAARGVAGIRLSMSAAGHNRQTVTDDSGAFELVLDGPGEYSVTLHEAGVRQTETIQVLEASDQRFDFVFAGGTIAGRVLAQGGTPVEGIRLSLAGRADTGSTGHVRSDEDGAFRFEGLRPGSYRLQAQRWMPFAGGEPYASPVLELELADGGTLDGVVLQLVEPCRIEGRVTTSDGRPAGGAFVIVSSVSDAELSPAWVQTDPGGVFRAHVEPGLWRASATRERFVSRTASVEARTGVAAELELELVAGTIVQVVLADVTEPIAALLTDADGHGYSHMQWRQGPEHGTVDELEPRGTRIGPVPPGTYRVTARRAGSRTDAAEGSLTLDGEPLREIVLVPAAAPEAEADDSSDAER